MKAYFPSGSFFRVSLHVFLALSLHAIQSIKINSRGLGDPLGGGGGSLGKEGVAFKYLDRHHQIVALVSKGRQRTGRISNV